MSKNELRQMRWFILAMIIILGFCMPFTINATVISGWMVLLDLMLLGIIFAMIGFSGFLSGCGRFATEFNLDEGLCYEICQVCEVTKQLSRDWPSYNKTILVLMQDERHKIEAVVLPSGGFKKFEVLGNKFIVPKSLGATVVKGRLFIPSR